MSDFNLGTVTAYGYAKDKGYTGTEDEFAALMASYADVAEQAAESAEQAAASATTATAKASEAAQSATAAASSKTAAETAQGGAETAAQTATTKAGEASTAATTATNKATEATTAATTATGKATEAAGSATTATTKAGEASTSATNAAASATRAQEILDSIPEDYSQLSEDVSDLKDGLNEKVDLPKAIVGVEITVQTGYYTASGFTSAGGFKAAKESVTEGETLLLTGSGNTYAYAYYFVNDSGTVISKADTALEMTDYQITVPNGATYVEINTSGTSKVIGLKRISYDTDFDISKYIVQPTTENEELDLTWDSGYRVNGTTLSPNGGYRSAVIPVSSGEVYDVVIYFKESWFYGVYLYDSNMTRLATYITGDGTTTRRYEQKISITSNGYMVVNAAAWNYFRAVYKVIALSADDRIEKLESTPWTGKTIWWCGTSIPANGAPVGEENLSYPAYVGKLLGANVINKAISSSCARRGWKNKETQSDPYGWTDVAWQNVFLAMGANLTEKQDLIDNYSTWKNIIGGDFNGSGSDGTGTGKPESLTHEWIDRINASSYENILMPYLDGTYDMPDLFVFDHGHNDYGNGETFAEMTTQPADAYDRSTFIGAMSFFFEQIFVANPHAKIVIISHYANDTVKQNTITTAQNNLANLWDLPIFDIYDKLGWSQQVITTTGYWDASTSKWVNSGGAEQQISMLWVHLRDGLHPSSDQSGKAIVQIGREIAQYLENNIVAERI